MSVDAPAPGGEPHGQRPTLWKTNLLFPIVVSVVGAVLVTTLTPLGQGLREIIFPTQATVTATLTLNGLGVANATTTLDGTPAGTISASGDLTVPDVGAGDHVLRLAAFGAVPVDRTFVVDREATAVNLGRIDLPSIAQLGYYVWQTPQRFNPKIDYAIALWIDGSEQTLKDVSKVTYRLPEPLSSKPVKGKKTSGIYCYTTSGTVNISDLFASGGAFGIASTKITLPDGILQLAALPTTERPPDSCVPDGHHGDRDNGGSGGTTGGGGGTTGVGGGNSGGSGGNSGGSGGNGGGGSGGDKSGGDSDEPSNPGSGDSPSSQTRAIACAIDPTGDTYQVNPDISAAIGTAVLWRNDGDQAMSLDITEDPAGWTAGDLAPGDSYSFTFTETGTWSYTCVYPKNKVSGQLTITD